MPLCLRFGGVASSSRESNKSCDKCARNSAQCLPDSTRKDTCECRRTKNIFNVLRRRWRRNKRRDKFDTRKCGDSKANGCQCNSGGVQPDFCVKHQKLKSWDSSTASATGFNSDSENHNDLDHSIIVDDNEDCSCFGSPSRRAFNNVAAKVVKLRAAASKSLSDISNTANISSLTSKTDSDSDLARITSGDQNATSYSNGLCTESTEGGEPSYCTDNPVSYCSAQAEQKIGNLTQELYKLSKYGWYWGPINRSEAESKLVDQPDGAFLVRDSSDDRYILSLSFRSYGKTLHTRIEHSNGLFSFYSQPEPEGHASIIELINQSMCYSQSGVFCYSRSRSPGSPSFPVRLTKPISRFTQVRSLQYLCRFVIRQYTRFDHIQKLPLPERIKGYLEEGHY